MGGFLPGAVFSTGEGPASLPVRLAIDDPPRIRSTLTAGLYFEELRRQGRADALAGISMSVGYPDSRRESPVHGMGKECGRGDE